MAYSNEFYKEFYVDNNDVVRWTSNNQVPFDDVLTEFLVSGLICQENVLRSMSARKIEAEIAIEQYVENRKKYGYSDEELFEMQAAFGDEEVIDIFTGERVVF